MEANDDGTVGGSNAPGGYPESAPSLLSPQMIALLIITLLVMLGALLLILANVFKVLPG